jgi:hypothetical protein
LPQDYIFMACFTSWKLYLLDTLSWDSLPTLGLHSPTLCFSITINSPALHFKKRERIAPSIILMLHNQEDSCFHCTEWPLELTNVKFLFGIFSLKKSSFLPKFLFTICFCGSGNPTQDLAHAKQALLSFFLHGC